MELSKLGIKAQEMDSRLVKWLMFIDGASQDQWEELAMDTPGLKKAMTTLEFLSQDKEARMQYEARKKALLDEQSALDYVESRGKATRGKEIAVNMLQKGLSISLIAEVTGLSEAEIEALGNQLH
ncbi:PD-(D/E)XK nuclease family transposase [compost metagenome]